jgi:hypothetical protein
MRFARLRARELTRLILHCLEKPACVSDNLWQEVPIRVFLEICWKSRLVCDREDFDFLHCEFLLAREEVFEGGIVRGRAVTPATDNAG